MKKEDKEEKFNKALENAIKSIDKAKESINKDTNSFIIDNLDHAINSIRSANENS